MEGRAKLLALLADAVETCEGMALESIRAGNTKYASGVVGRVIPRLADCTRMIETGFAARKKNGTEEATTDE